MGKEKKTSLKDKAKDTWKFEGRKKNHFQVYKTPEMWVKLSDAEEEIEKIINLWKEAASNNFHRRKEHKEEIQTLVELLRGIKNDYGMILSFNYRDKINKTLKKYE